MPKAFCTQTDKKCHTLTMLPHYLWKIKISNLSQIWKKYEQKMSHEPVKFSQLSEDKAAS